MLLTFSMAVKLWFAVASVGSSRRRAEIQEFLSEEEGLEGGSWVMISKVGQVCSQMQQALSVAAD
jgi:hypothetical protein